MGITFIQALALTNTSHRQLFFWKECELLSLVFKNISKIGALWARAKFVLLPLTLLYGLINQLWKTPSVLHIQKLETQIYIFLVYDQLILWSIYWWQAYEKCRKLAFLFIIGQSIYRIYMFSSLDGATVCCVVVVFCPLLFCYI